MVTRYRKLRDVLLISFLILVGDINSARAAVVSHDYTGTITRISGTVFGLDLSIGQPVEGRITYNTSGPVFDFGVGAGSVQPLPSGMSAIIGGATVQSAGDASLQML